MNTGAAAQLVLVNGVPADSVSALERGLHYGDGLFETLGCVAGRPRFLELHLQRLARGCAQLGLPAPPLSAVAHELQELAASADRAILKLIMTRGPALARGYALTGREQPTRILLRYPWPVPEQDAHDAGVRVRLGRLVLSENPALAGIKHCNRLEQVLARAEWSDPGIAEALLFSRSGALISGTMSNVFLVLDGVLLTPRLELCGVAGIMRRVVLEAAAECALPAEERLLGRAELAAAEEIFLTNALTGIRRVGELEGRVLTGASLTRRLQAAIAPLLAGGYVAPGSSR